MSVLWRESWASMANSYLAAAGSSERIDHRSLQDQHEEGDESGGNWYEEKAIWLTKAAKKQTVLNEAYPWIAKWRGKNNTRAKEQQNRLEFRDALTEAVEVYKTFSELDLEIVVDVRSFTITHLAEPEEIITKQKQVLANE